MELAPSGYATPGLLWVRGGFGLFKFFPWRRENPKVQSNLTGWKAVKPKGGGLSFNLFFCVEKNLTGREAGLGSDTKGTSQPQARTTAASNTAASNTALTPSPTPSRFLAKYRS